jgi:hypothetical protein
MVSIFFNLVGFIILNQQINSHFFKKSQMKIINLIAIFFVAIFVIGTASCNKNDEFAGTGTLKISLSHRADSEVFQLNKMYKNANGDSLTFSMFKYYLSNFSLTKSDGSVYTIPKDSCYFLVDVSNVGSTTLSLKNIPAADYQTVSFTIGIDSSKSVASASERIGVLDPASGGQGMYWVWNSGYIFVKAEGTSPQAPLVASTGLRSFKYHIGLFGGYSSATLNNIKKLSLSKSNEVAKVRQTITPSVHTYVDIMEMFKTPNTIKIAQNPIVMVTPFSAEVAANYIDMFRIDHIHN